MTKWNVDKNTKSIVFTLTGQFVGGSQPPNQKFTFLFH